MRCFGRDFGQETQVKYISRHILVQQTGQQTLGQATEKAVRAKTTDRRYDFKCHWTNMVNKDKLAGK